MMRMPVVIANWKMNKTIGEAVEYAHLLRGSIKDIQGVEAILAPSFPLLRAVSEVVEGSGIGLAAQTIYWEDRGAYTGEISGLQLRDAGCGYVLVGHSERRRYFAEDNQVVNRKVHATLRHQLIPVVCVGEDLRERELGKTLGVIAEQMEQGLAQVDAGGLMLAYEPVWAIGTGEAVKPEEAQEVHHFIRNKMETLCGPEVAASTRILYGGSVTPDNASTLMAEPEVDGLLVGGASLKWDDFSQIVLKSARSEK